MPEFLKSQDWLAFSSVTSVIGVGIALWGIWVTYQQVKLVKTASEAAEAAIRDLKLRIANFDVVGEVTSAENSLNWLKDDYRTKDEEQWRRQSDRLATSLISIRENFEQANERTTDQLSSAISHASALTNRISIKSREASNDVAKIHESFRDIHTALVKVRVQLQRDQI